MDRFGYPVDGGLHYLDDSDDGLELIHEQPSPDSDDNLDADFADGYSSLIEDDNNSDISSHISLSSESEAGDQSDRSESEESDRESVEELQPVQLGAWLLNGGIIEVSPSPQPNSSQGSVRSGSHSPSERASSIDSLFVDQRNDADLYDDQGVDRDVDLIHQELYGLQDRQRLEFAERIEQGARQLRELGERIRRDSEAIQREHRRRHQPYPPPHPRHNHRLAEDEVDLFGDIQFEEDELVEMEVARHRRDRARAQDHAARQRTPPPVIDLTAEPDSPEEVVILQNGNRRNHAQVPAPPAPRPIPAPRNPRRHGSLNHRTPSLARSDGSILGGAEVIDLTEMDDDAPPRPVPPRPEPMEPRLPRPHGQPRNIGAWRPPPGFEQIDLVNDNREANNNFFNVPGVGLAIGLPGFLQRFGRGQRVEDDVQVIGAINNPPPQRFPFPANNGNNVANPLAANLPNFNYQANGYNNAGPAKTPYIPPPPPKEGFTRDTGPDVEAMCPSCEEDLAYDPDEELQSPPSKKRNRRDREVHHFWAVKECGHVYCRKCFEGRRGTKTVPTTMRVDPKNAKKVLCFVDDCDTDVTQKHSWVGIFL
jgi:hypothetical protein